MSALFNFSSFVVVILLTICTCTFVKSKGAPAVTHGRVPSLLSTCSLARDHHSLPRPAAPSLLGERTG